jgi:hypothetical protein
LICKASIDSGCNIIVRNARQDDTAMHVKCDSKRSRKLIREENAVFEDASNVSIVVVDVAKSTPSQSRRNTWTSKLMH